jgi:hypothetical protein
LVCWLVGLLVGWLTIFFVNTLFIPLGWQDLLFALLTMMLIRTHTTRVPPDV